MVAIDTSTQSAMARIRRPRRIRNQQKPESLHSFRSITQALGCFVGLIGVVVIIAWRQQPQSADTSSEPNVATANHQHDHRVFTNPKDVPLDVIADLDAILVLGGGAPKAIDSPPDYVQRRCDDASIIVQMYSQIAAATGRIGYRKKKHEPSKQDVILTAGNNDEQQYTAKIGAKTTAASGELSRLPIICLSAGTAHVPQLLGKDGLPIWESTSCAAYLANKHKLSRNVYVETTSYDTIGNAFFTRTSFTDINQWKNLLVVTNEFHMDRTIEIFDWIFTGLDNDNDNIRGQKRKYSQYQHPYQLYYLSSPNVGLSAKAIEARHEKEIQSTKMVRELLAPQYKTLSQVHWFLTHEHSLYTSNKLVERGRGRTDAADSKASDMVKQSYGGG